MFSWDEEHQEHSYVLLLVLVQDLGNALTAKDPRGMVCMRSCYGL